ncbi:phenylacetic acid degradation protein PaaN [Actinomadura formosensis]|uniref:phenylacetic acid degradation protein PaaN n=1 Tax=Actinomadura formosensis TaxID=60706 RepID=UPI000A622CAE|nr:phenylacetic acid degradation protein PaaN [Actinomadura formosensis]
MSTDPMDEHRSTLTAALRACRTRESWTAYPEDTASHPNGESGKAAGKAWLADRLGSRFPLEHPGNWRVQQDEVSPYTGLPLGISYPAAEPEALFAAAHRAWPAWRQADPQTRVDVCLEICEQLYLRNFELAYAAMHTAGQSFGMSWAGSGTNAIDRGIEAIALAHAAMERVPRSAVWSRAFGTHQVTLDKRYRLVPRGIAVVIACASFPAWNVYPALFASLATGNPVILKPHPTSVLQMAEAVRICRTTLAEAGFSPDLVGLSLDTVAEPVAKRLISHPGTRIVDFTGSAAFGSWVEANAHPAIAYTETSGANSVLIESLSDPDAQLRAIAGSLCLFSAQMCTSPQNIYVPRGGIRTADGEMTPDEFADALAAAVQAVSTVPRRAAAVMATVQSPHTLDLLNRVRDQAAEKGRVVLEPAPYEHPEYPGARTSGPLLARLDIADHDLYGRERFGPVAFVITADDADRALEQATRDAREQGAITAFAYSTDEGYLDRAEAAYALAGAALTSNLSGPMPLNFSAAYSDYHVTGLNPAGNASLTDDSFVTGRFRITQSRRPVATG